jgi:plasmid stabilization system protein ParE
MEYKVVWSPKAQESLFEIIDYLDNNWSPEVKENFILKTKTLIERISKRPYSYRASIAPNFHEALITKHNLLIYRVVQETVQVVIVWDTRKNPKRKVSSTKSGVRSMKSK